MNKLVALSLVAIFGVTATWTAVKLSPQEQPVIKKTAYKLPIAPTNIDPVRDSKVDLRSPESILRHIAYLKSVERNKEEGPGSPESKADWYEAYYAWISVRLNGQGLFDPNYLHAANQHRDAMPRGKQSYSPGGVAEQLGPVNSSDPVQEIYFGHGPTSGRKNDIAVYPGNPLIMAVASAGGGIWKTTNGGTNWAPLSEKWTNLLTSSVAFHPTNSNIILAGTGDREGFFGHYGNGIMRSTDGGTNWTQIGPEAMRISCIDKIVFDPANPTIVLALGGNGYSNTDAVWRSTDSGLTFTAVSGLSLTVVAWDDLVRTTGGVYYLAGSDGTTPGFLYKSTNSGATWTVVSNPCVAANPHMDLGASLVNANTLYLLAIGDEKIYKTTNGGTSWTNIKGNFLNGDANSGANYMWAQKDYDKHLTVSADGANDVVYVGLIGINMDVNGDGTWTDISRTFSATPPNYLHADQHCGIPHPTDRTIVYFGLDGGIFKWKLTNAATGAGTWTSLNATIKDYQAYHVSAHPTDPGYLMTGLQDNCTIGSRGNFAAWTSLSAGDGSWSAFDRNNPAVQYTSAQGASVYRYATATTLVSTFIKPTAGNFGFIAPLVTAGSAGNEVFLGGDFLYKWTGVGRVWTQLNMPCGSTQPASELAVAPANGNVIYSGNPEAIVMLTRDKGATFAQIDNASIDRPIGGIGIAFSNSYDVVVGMQGQGADHLWRCSNTLAAVPVWTNVSGTGPTGLPNVPINAVARDPYEVGRWYVGTDVGAFMTVNYGATWVSMTTLGLPAVGVQHMTFDSSKQFLIIATYGRGIWRVPIVTAATTFSISGNIKQGAANLPGITTNLQVWKESSSTATSTPNAPIPDNNPAWTVLPVTVTTSQRIVRVSLYLNITHTFRGDVEAYLQSPDGSFAQVLSSSADNGANIVRNFTLIEFNGLLSNGVWKLWVRDVGAGDIGTVNQFKVIPYFLAYGAAGSTTTNASGNYTFANLVAGKYKIYPTEAGRTFAPSSILVDLGPNATGKSFLRNP